MHQIWTSTVVPHFFHTFLFHIISMVLLHRYLWSNSRHNASKDFYERTYIPTGRFSGVREKRRLECRGKCARITKCEARTLCQCVFWKHWVSYPGPSKCNEKTIVMKRPLYPLHHDSSLLVQLDWGGARSLLERKVIYYFPYNILTVC